jgi:hypothetical protein
MGLTTLPCKKKFVEKPPRNSAGFCGGGQGLSWAVESRKEEIHILYSSQNSIRVFRRGRKRWAGYVGEMKNIQNISWKTQ